MRSIASQWVYTADRIFSSPSQSLKTKAVSTCSLGILSGVYGDVMKAVGASARVYVLPLDPWEMAAVIAMEM